MEQVDEFVGSRAKFGKAALSDAKKSEPSALTNDASAVVAEVEKN